MRYRALFLHGAGFNCEMERERFGDSLPILWWDQPAPLAGDRRPFDWLVATAEERLAALAENGPVDVVALSFGGQVARELARRRPELILSVVLLACPPVRPAFPRLAKSLLKRLGPRERLQNALAAAELRGDAQNILALVQAIASVPDFLDYYWGPDSLPAWRKRLKEILSGVRPLDFPAFAAILKDFLREDRPGETGVPAFSGKARVIWGRHDPLTDIEADSEMWRRVFPNAEFHTVNAGHLIHLERPVSEWFPME